MTVADDDKFFSKDVQSKNRKTWQHRYVAINKVASHVVGAAAIIAGMEALALVLKLLKVGSGTICRSEELKSFQAWILLTAIFRSSLTSDGDAISIRNTLAL